LFSPDLPWQSGQKKVNLAGDQFVRRFVGMSIESIYN